MSETKSTAWKSRAFRFLGAQAVSLLGSSLVQYAIIWHITLTTSSGLMMTIATLCGFVPQLCISLFAGVWVDRYHRKYLAMLSDCIIAAATLVLALLFLSGQQSIWLLFGVLLLRSAGTGVQTPCVAAILPQLVPREHLMRVSGLFSTMTALIAFLSPALSGLILSLTGISATFFVDVFTAILGIAITATIAIPMHKVTAGKSALGDIAAGFAYLKENAFVRRILLFVVLISVLISPSAFLTPLLVIRTFGAEVWRLTLGEMTFGAGAALGGLLIGAWGGFSSRMRTVAFAAACYGALMLGLGFAPFFLLYLVFNALIGMTMPCFNSPIMTLLQEKVDTAMQGRVFSMLQICTSCALPLGMLLFGPLSDLVPVQSLMLVAGTLVLLCSIFALFSRKFRE